jgi:hypothetical protein
MGNAGLRFVIEQRDDRRFYFSYTDRGQLHEGTRGYTTLVEAAEEATVYHRLAKLAQWHQKQRAMRPAQNQ